MVFVLPFRAQQKKLLITRHGRWMPAGDSQQARERTDKLDRCGSQQATASRRETVSVLVRVLVFVLVLVSVLVSARSHDADNWASALPHDADNLASARSDGADNLASALPYDADNLASARSHGADNLAPVTDHITIAVAISNPSSSSAPPDSARERPRPCNP